MSGTRATRVARARARGEEGAVPCTGTASTTRNPAGASTPSSSSSATCSVSGPAPFCIPFATSPTIVVASHWPPTYFASHSPSQACFASSPFLEDEKSAKCSALSTGRVNPSFAVAFSLSSLFGSSAPLLCPFVPSPSSARRARTSSSLIRSQLRFDRSAVSREVSRFNSNLFRRNGEDERKERKGKEVQKRGET